MGRPPQPINQPIKSVGARGLAQLPACSLARGGTSRRAHSPQPLAGPLLTTHRGELEEHVAACGPEQQALKGGQLVYRDCARHKAQLHRLGLKGLGRLQQGGTYVRCASACGSVPVPAPVSRRSGGQAVGKAAAGWRRAGRQAGRQKAAQGAQQGPAGGSLARLCAHPTAAAARNAGCANSGRHREAAAGSRRQAAAGLTVGIGSGG